MEKMDDNNNTPMSVKDWFITIFITAIPLVGFIMLFVWGFGSGTHPSKANWAKATLLWFLVIAVLYAVFFATMGAALLSNIAN